MDKFVIQLGTMSIQSSIVIGVVFLVRLVFERMHVPKKYMCILWILPYLCMVCPWKLESEFGFWQTTARMQIEEMQDKQQIEDLQEHAPKEPIMEGIPSEQMQSMVQENKAGQEWQGVQKYQAEQEGEVSSNSVLDVKTESHVPARTAPSLYTILGYIWLVGVLSLFTYNVVSYVKLRRNLVCSICTADNIYVADDIEVPFVLGIVRPRIYLPSDMQEESMEYVLAHEKTHIRRMDPMKKMLALCISILHWFNPLSWVAFVFMVKDMEMACDEETILQLGLERKKDYAAALLSLSTDKRSFLGAPLAFDEGDVKSRICNILKYKKAWRIVSGFAVVLIVILAAGFMTRRAEEEQASQDNVMYQLVQYQVDLTGDDMDEQIVFEVDAEEVLGLTDAEILEKIWKGDLEITAKVLDGASGLDAVDEEEQDSSEDNTAEVTLWQAAFSGKDGASGNLAVCNYTYNATYAPCLLRYDNEVSDGKGRFWYELLAFESGKEPTVVASNEAVYDVVNVAELEGQQLSAEYIAMVEQVLLVEEELQEFLRRAGVKGRLLNVVDNPESCYLYQEDSRTWRNSFDTFALQAEGTGAEWKIEDYFYPKSTEGTTVLPENARERILAGEILCMDVTEENDTAGNLDLDGDGQTERIYLEAIEGYDDYGNARHIDISYRIRVDNVYYENYCSSIRPQVMLFSPDGEVILLAIFDEGPSADPLTTFYRYDAQNKQVIWAGEMPSDFSETIIENGIIRTRFLADMIETASAVGYWVWDGQCMVLRDEEEYGYIAGVRTDLVDEHYVYEYITYEEYADNPQLYAQNEEWSLYGIENPLRLLETLTVYSEKNEKSQAFIMKPQNVYCVSTDLKEWIYLEAEDGTKGWLRIEFYGKIPSLGKDSREVFEGLSFAG